ncbi:MAG: hypothetical protein AAGF04_00005, partial [Chlamydiota bacterium]
YGPMFYSRKPSAQRVEGYLKCLMMNQMMRTESQKIFKDSPSWSENLIFSTRPFSNHIFASEAP